MFGSNDTGQLGYGEDAITNPNTPIVVNLGTDLEGATITKYNSSYRIIKIDFKANYYNL
jgi:hypothetical protein